MTKRFEDSLPYFRLVRSKGIQHAPAARGGIEDDIEDDQNVVRKNQYVTAFITIVKSLCYVCNIRHINTIYQNNNILR